MPTDDELFTSEEVLGGFSAKRARLLLFQIESRTAYLMMQLRRAVDRYLTEEAAEQQDLAFFEALAQGREPPVRPTIRDLERYALQWQSLVPPNPTLQATLASLLGYKYRFAQRDVPHIRQALGLDSEEVQHAFERQYQQPPGTIYTERESSIEWVRWRWNMLSEWLENLSPFWTAYALTFTEMVGASILALPIALAGVGPLPGVIILLVMGVFNVFTIAAMAEAVTRNGSIRYQGKIARSWLSISPLLLIFLLSEWLLVQKLESFSQLWGFLGIVAVPVEIGIFPALLLFASRRKGEHVPKFVLPFLAHPLMIGTIYLVSVGILFLHGLFIWQDTFQKGVALLVGGFMLVVTYLMARQGAFVRRLVVEVRQDATEEDTGTFTVTDSGRVAIQTSVKLGYADEERVYQGASGIIAEFSALHSATFYLPGTRVQELSVWLHRVTPGGQSQNLPALLRVSSGKGIREFPLGGANKPLVLPLGDGGKKERGGSAGELGQLEIEVQLAANTTRQNNLVIKPIVE